MTFNQFRRYLRSLGAEFDEGTRHTKVYLNGRQAVLARHGTRDMGEGIRQKILRQLDVRRKDE